MTPGKASPAARDTVATRFIRILRTEGLKGIGKRIGSRLRSRCFRLDLHVFALSRTPSSASSPFGAALDPAVSRLLVRFQPFLDALEFEQVTIAEDRALDEITAIDPWSIPKSASVEKLQEGWLCFAARYRDRIIADSWARPGPLFYEPFLKRSFRLAPDEMYAWRTVCAPEFRGRAVAPWLNDRIVRHLAATAKATTFLGFVRKTNPAQCRSLLQTGWSIVGRVGFLEVFGLRFSYLLGRQAFAAEKRRVLVHFPRS